MKSFLDRNIDKLVSRKLSVFVIGTLGWLALQSLNGDQWIQLACVYIGGQAVVDTIKALKR